MAPHRCGECCTTIERLGVDFGAGPVLEDVDLHLHCGELTTIVGPNGAGKSTLLRALLGEVPHTGRIRFHPVFAQGGRRGSFPVMGYVPQGLDFDRATPLSVLDFFAAGLGSWPPAPLGHGRRVKQVAVEALALVGAEGLSGRRLGSLSGGELQRVLLALALTPMPNLLLLDEPVSSLDLPAREAFYRLVSGLRQRLDLSIVMVSHDLAGVVSVSDRLVFLNRRVVCAGPPGDVLAHPEVRHAFGLDWDSRA